MNVGLVGCGSASSLYLEGCKQFENVRFVACADLVDDKAQTRASEFDIHRVCAVETLLDDPLINIVLNLTDPQAHAEIGIAALEAGKHLYQEKPFAVELNDARMMSDLAVKKGLRIGCAPDSFLGAGLQTCRELIDEGAIGEPVACTAFMLCHGHEDWHPSPDQFYGYGGGPMFDMGPYYLTALINLLGPIASVSASGKITSNERVISSKPRYGEKIRVEVPTHICGLVNFASGVVGSIVMSFDVWASQLPSIEIYGTEGTLIVPDPNTYGGPIRLFSTRGPGWLEMPVTRRFSKQSRGIGLADMICAIQRGCAHRANENLAYHVLETLHCFHNASVEGRQLALASTCSRPEPLPKEFPPVHD